MVITDFQTPSNDTSKQSTTPSRGWSTPWSVLQFTPTLGCCTSCGSIGSAFRWMKSQETKCSAREGQRTRGKDCTFEHEEKLLNDSAPARKSSSGLTSECRIKPWELVKCGKARGEGEGGSSRHEKNGVAISALFVTRVSNRFQ